MIERLVDEVHQPICGQLNTAIPMGVALSEKGQEGNLQFKSGTTKKPEIRSGLFATFYTENGFKPSTHNEHTLTPMSCMSPIVVTAGG
jgi:hypothetical protein